MPLFLQKSSSALFTRYFPNLMGSTAFCSGLIGAVLVLTPLARGEDGEDAEKEAANRSDKWQCQASGAGWSCQPGTADPNLGTLYEPVTEGPAVTGRVVPRTDAVVDVTRQIAAAQRQLDWVPREQMTPEQRQDVPAFCAGAYIEPEYVAPELKDVDPETQPLEASARSSESSETGTTVLTGDVVIQQGNRRIESNKATIDRDSSIATIDGEGSFREPGVLLIGQDTVINLETKEVTVQDASFVTHEASMRGTAQVIYRDEKEIIYVTKGRLTRCPPAVNTWHLAASKLELNQETGVGVAKHATLNVKKVPVLYTPYISFPIDDRRKSGLLTPSLGSSDDGFEFALPYYWNIAPNYDATITPRVITDRGVGAEAEFRFLTENHEGSIGGAYLPDDDEYENNQGQLETRDRWLINVQNQGQLFDTVNTSIDFTRVSDDEYFSDLESGLNTSSNTYLLQRGSLSYNQQNWSLVARAMGYQLLDDNIADQNEPYDRLPQLIFTGALPFWDDQLALGLRTEYTHFDRDNDGLTGLFSAIGQRLRTEASVGLNLEWSYAFIRPTVKYKHIQYFLDDLDNSFDDNPDVSAPLFSLDAGIFLERDFSLFGSALTQTFEPRLYYLFVDDDDHTGIPDFDTGELTFSYNQLFREDRFVGGDRIGDTDQLSVGITQRLLKDNGRELARASIGQIFYFDDREVFLNPNSISAEALEDSRHSESSYAAELMVNLSSGWHLFGDIEWDPNDNRTNESSIRLRYKGEQYNKLFNIGYRVRKDRRILEQTDISMMWPITNHWTLMARWNQDIINNRLVEGLAGVQYDSCCWALRLVSRRWINDDDATLANPDNADEKEAIYLQFVFKGLGGFGESLESVLSDSIVGYEERNARDL